MHSPLRALTVFLFLASLGACSGSSSSGITNLPEATQRAAYQQCSAQLNIPAQLQVLALRSGGVSVFAVNGNGVSLSQARSLNQCARNTLLAG